MLVTTHLALYSFFLPSGQDARHLSRYGTEGQLCCLFVAALVVFFSLACAGLVCWLRCNSRCVPLFVGLVDNGGRYTAGFAGDDAHHVTVQALVFGSGTASRVLLDKDVDMPRVVLDRCPVLTCRKLWSLAVAVRRSARVVSVWQQRHKRTVQLCSRQLPRVVSSGQLRSSFRALHTGPTIRCIHCGIWRDICHKSSVRTTTTSRLSTRLHARVLW